MVSSIAVAKEDKSLPEPTTFELRMARHCAVDRRLSPARPLDTLPTLQVRTLSRSSDRKGLAG